ncbi:helix-loop-helix DNA-binding domain-containing protein [Jimgerdemannia flammicorona]|uniref:Helix-loop-helix DNA-binding domain-containing protein n=2 Tax=Jimgerdemannia flammicorona TaxID=994334 RepID=A0A433D2L7_9FUNG|nr:helix-loop-helix DNA-binding domain-containing protein [Jimgerdemannia flammicorona]RUS26893.1 helix-loop-helix DNA-binding domain-containing protein [Jimgerdemannia flammicorona]
MKQGVCTLANYLPSLSPFGHPTTISTVERRRRDNINEKIQELGQLLPEQLVDGANKPNKGAILRKSVDHIKTLQTEVTTYAYRVKELESLLEKYRISGASLPSENGAPGASSQAASASQQGGGSMGMQGLQISGPSGNGNA